MKHQMGVAMLLAAMVVGCKKESPAPVQPPAPANPGDAMPGSGPAEQPSPGLPIEPPVITPPAENPTTRDTFVDPMPPIINQSGGEGIAGANPPPEVVATQPGQTVYVVKKGDSLYSIARAHYGSGAKYKDILAANPGLTTDLKVGQEIILP